MKTKNTHISFFFIPSLKNKKNHFFIFFPKIYIHTHIFLPPINTQHIFIPLSQKYTKKYIHTHTRNSHTHKIRFLLFSFHYRPSDSTFRQPTTTQNVTMAHLPLPSLLFHCWLVGGDCRWVPAEQGNCRRYCFSFSPLLPSFLSPFRLSCWPVKLLAASTILSPFTLFLYFIFLCSAYLVDCIFLALLRHSPWKQHLLFPRYGKFVLNYLTPITLFSSNVNILWKLKSCMCVFVDY